MRRSRLTKRLEQKTKATIFVSLLGTFIIIFAFVKFGLPMLVNLSLLISSSHSSQDATKQNASTFVSPPVLNALPEATNSAMLTISGSAASKQQVALYINDEQVSKTDVKDDNTFVFDSFRLPSSSNEIKVKAIQGSSDSSFSDSYTVAVKNKPPTLSVDSPSDGQSFSKDSNTTQVSGKTDVGAKVTVNGFWAVVDGNGNYSYTLPLKNGDNQISVIATDAAGNTIKIDRKVTYSQ